MPRAATLAVMAAVTLAAPACAHRGLPSMGGPGALSTASSTPSPRKASGDRGSDRSKANRPAAPRTPPGAGVTSVYRMSPIFTWGEHATSQPAAPTVRSLQDPSLIRCQLERGALAAAGPGEALFSFPFELWDDFALLGGGLAGQPVEAARAITASSAQEFARHMIRNVAVMSPVGSPVSGCGTRFSVFIRGNVIDSPELLVHHR